jgi:hypothetical protein
MHEVVGITRAGTPEVQVVLCEVKDCRFSTFPVSDPSRASHTTFGHTCGLCGRAGHGQLECGNAAAIEALGVYESDIMPMDTPVCDIEGCQYARTHARAAHHCDHCKQRCDHGASACTARDAVGQSRAQALAQPTFAPFPCPACKTFIATVDAPVLPTQECAVCKMDKALVPVRPCGCLASCSDCLQKWSETWHTE